MKIINDIAIKDFEFWSGGKDRADSIKSNKDWRIIENYLEDLFPDGITATELNDIFWFDFDSLAQACGYADEEEYLKDD